MVFIKELSPSCANKNRYKDQKFHKDYDWKRQARVTDVTDVTNKGE